LVSTQLAQTLVDSRAPLVVLTSAGSLGALMVVVDVYKRQPPTYWRPPAQRAGYAKLS